MVKSLKILIISLFATSLLFAGCTNQIDSGIQVDTDEEDVINENQTDDEVEEILDEEFDEKDDVEIGELV